MFSMRGVDKAIGKTIERMESGYAEGDDTTPRLVIYFTDGSKFSYLVTTKSWVEFEDGTKEDAVNVQWFVSDAEAGHA